MSSSMRWYVGFSLMAAMAADTRAAVGDNSVGVNIHVGYQSFIDAAADLGVAWVRVDGNWAALEPSQGTYAWQYMDDTVNRANTAGLMVFMTLGYTPDWVARHGDGGSSDNDVPDSSTEWASFVGAAVQRYRAMGVTHFGMWNEANLGGFFAGSSDEYVDIIAVPGAAAVRAACSDCKVLGPEAANVGEADDWLDAVLARAPLSTWDIITHHSYNGFAELGWNIWSGDSFINALDDQRFTFTRRSLRQVLDENGWAGEVWITETGYRTEPVNDANEEQRQATYVTRVLEEQLARAWYTNTFFYEIEDCGPSQPACDIDGFGIMRATSGGDEGSKTFPADYRRKPAFLAIQQFIDSHPAISGAAPPPQCGDGDDNDSDGRIDGADRGCSTALDDNEADDPPRKLIEAHHTGALTVDGTFNDVGQAGWVDLAPEDWHGTEPLGVGDLAVRVAARWSDAALWLAFDVTDDVQDNTNADADLWMADSVQLGFDIDGDGGDGYDNVDDQEINFALVGSQSRAYRFHGPSTATADWEVAVRREGTQTRYEIKLPSSALPPLNPATGTELGFSFLVNDADGSGRSGWMEWTSGIGVTKTPEAFGRIRLLAPSGTSSSSSTASSGPGSSSSVAASSSVPSSSSVNPSSSASSSSSSGGAHPSTSASDSHDAGPPVDGGSPGGCACEQDSRDGEPATMLALFFLGLVLARRIR